MFSASIIIQKGLSAEKRLLSGIVGASPRTLRQADRREGGFGGRGRSGSALHAVPRVVVAPREDVRRTVRERDGSDPPRRRAERRRRRADRPVPLVRRDRGLLAAGRPGAADAR